MKGFLNDFKTFISKGNVLDMAIGVIVATAFGKITTALVNDVLMPLIGWIFGGTDATEALNITLTPAVLDAEGNILTPASVLGLGVFLNAILDFVIIAFICFVIVRSFNKAKAAVEKEKLAAAAAAQAEADQKAAEEAAAKAAELSREEKLLTEIRDLLQNTAR